MEIEMKKTLHEGKKSFHCGMCDNAYSTKGNLTRHVVKFMEKSHIHGSIVTKVYSIELRHHEKLIDFKCEHCGKEFPSFIEITRHVRTIRHLHELIYSYMRTQHTSSR